MDLQKYTRSAGLRWSRSSKTQEGSWLATTASQFGSAAVARLFDALMVRGGQKARARELGSGLARARKARLGSKRKRAEPEPPPELVCKSSRARASSQAARPNENPNLPLLQKLFPFPLPSSSPPPVRHAETESLPLGGARSCRPLARRLPPSPQQKRRRPATLDPSAVAAPPLYPAPPSASLSCATRVPDSTVDAVHHLAETPTDRRQFTQRRA
ncbi:hypothetical protein [Oryza sativa Japonica Group]|uniref:Uncharacterized protein n=2 Tax=Oryza sativa subsp. japonica TaxID=39947 RepID=Q7F4S7_ORYSJ|nr:hypothetical protein [Oryza sativa Japonica Group]BAB89783.1 hypothetical protein [Oryza sativa Japonica Group]